MQNKAIEVISHSLAAANAALDLLEPTRANGDVVGQQQAVEVQAAPALVVQEPVVISAREINLSEALYDELADSQYNLRTVAELCSKFNVTAATLYDALDDMDEAYVTRNRRSDSAPLVGLNTRN